MSDTASNHSLEPSGNPYFAPADGRCLINELPAELLSHIFTLGSSCESEDCDDDDDEDDCCSSSTVSSANSDDSASTTSSDYERYLPLELLVSRVCRQWRAVAIGTPLLWNNITYESFGDVPRIEAYVQRAKGAPLDISIDCTLDDGPVDSDDEESAEENQKQQLGGLAKVVNILCPEVEHWRTFELMVSQYELMQIALTYLANAKSAPLLEELRLYHYEDSEEREEFVPAPFRDQGFVLFGNNVPRLREVALWGVHLSWEKTTFLTGLEELELAYHPKDVRPSYRDFLCMLRASPKLQTLTMCESGPKGMPAEWLQSLQENPLPDTNPDEPLLDIALPSVKSLVLAYLPQPFTLALLDHISFPKLTALAVDFEEDDYAPVAQRFARPMTGTNRSLLSGLENLKISGFPCADVSTLLSMAECLQKLKSLSIHLEYCSPVWQNILARTEDVPAENVQRIYLPQMETLYLTAATVDFIRQLVEARKEREKPLKELFVDKDTDVPEDEKKWLKENVEVFDYFEGSDEEDAVFEDDAVFEVDVDSDGGEWDDEDQDNWEEDEWIDNEWDGPIN